MRQAIRGLTTRGRCFLAAGIAALLCAIVFGQRDLLRAAVLLIALPLVSALVVARTRYRLASSRRMEPVRTTAGQPSRVRAAAGERLPAAHRAAAGRGPDPLRARARGRGSSWTGWSQRASARSPTASGRSCAAGTPSARSRSGSSDPFGMCELVRSFTRSDALVVTPVTEKLPSVPLGGDWAGSGDSRSRRWPRPATTTSSPASTGAGDDLRRVHWRSTAKYGELMVRREEQPWESRAIVLLDTRAAAHRGDGPASSLEWAVSAAASIGIHLAQAGFAIDMITDDGSVVGGNADGTQGVGASMSGTHTELLLDSLAVVEGSAGRTLHGAIPVLRATGDALTAVVLGEVTAAEAADLVRARHSSGTSVAVLLDVSTWQTGSHRDRLQHDGLRSRGRRVRRSRLARGAAERRAAAR